MTDTQPASIDMARAAVAAARAAARSRGDQPQKKPTRIRRETRSGGRDPMGLGSAITAMMTERGWEPPEAGGSILDQWPTIAPELEGKVFAERFEHDTGTLHLRPVSDTYATQLRLFTPQMIRRIREKTGHNAVRQIQVLRPGPPTRATAADDDTALMAQPETAEQLPQPAPDGYRQARESLLAHRPDRETTDPHMAFAVARQNRAMTNPANREQAAQFTDAVVEAERVAEPEMDRSTAVRMAALAFKHSGGSSRDPRRAFDVA